MGIYRRTPRPPRRRYVHISAPAAPPAVPDIAPVIEAQRAYRLRAQIAATKPPRRPLRRRLVLPPAVFVPGDITGILAAVRQFRAQAARAASRPVPQARARRPFIPGVAVVAGAIDLVPFILQRARERVRVARIRPARPAVRRPPVILHLPTPTVDADISWLVRHIQDRHLLRVRIASIPRPRPRARGAVFVATSTGLPDLTIAELSERVRENEDWILIILNELL